MKSKNNMIEVIKELNALGYTEEFKVMGDKLYWVGKSVKYNYDQFEVDHAYRFESSDTPEDTSLIYGITIPKKGVKGILFDVFDAISSLEENFVVNKILSVEPMLLTHQDSNSELKSCFIPKVHKSNFNEDPHRYELRKDFPDFPACPFSESFSMLGFDNKLEEYVWLTTSILRDTRLNTVHFKPALN